MAKKSKEELRHFGMNIDPALSRLQSLSTVVSQAKLFILWSADSMRMMLSLSDAGW